MSALRSRGGPARIALGAALALLAACDGGPTTPDGQGYPAQLAVAITLQSEADGGGEGDAYDKANLVNILVRSGGAVLFEQVAHFEPQAETHVPIAVRVQEDTQAELDVTLLRDLSPLFRGSVSLTLVPNEVVPANLTLVPVAASISVPGSLPTLRSQGETAVLPGSVLFATGDVATSLHLLWESLTPSIVTVQTTGTVSSMVAVRSGVGLLRASFSPFQSLVPVTVEIVPARVTVEPATNVLPLGDTLRLTYAALDALGNPVPGTTATWSSSAPTIAPVTPTGGLVLGLSRGTATIRATVGSITGEATVEVVAPPPSVGTEPASGVGVFTATLHATVSAKGSPSTAWFRYGTDATLATAAETPHTDIGSGEADQSFSATAGGLSALTTYYFRAVASNDGGERQGEILSFTTLPLVPPTVAALAPSLVTSTSARLLGTVDPRGSATLAHFEWGTEATLSSPFVTPDVALDAVTPETEIDRLIAGLTPDGQLYYYRVVATNAAGTSRSDILSFRTAPLPPSSFSASFDPPYLYMYWMDNSSSETGFSVERSVVSATTGFAETLAAPPGIDGYGYADQAPPFPARVMYYRVRACNDFACSDPSNVETVVAPDPSIVGTFHICYSPGTGSCDYPYSSVKVDLVGSSGTVSSFSDIYGYFTFDPVAAGSYTVHMDDVPCSFNVRANDQAVTVGWGERRTVDFYADYDPCGSPKRGSGGG